MASVPQGMENPIHECYFGHEHVTVIEACRDLHSARFARAVGLPPARARADDATTSTSVIKNLARRRVSNHTAFHDHGGLFVFLWPSREHAVRWISVYSALVPWTFFANAIMSSSNSLVGSSSSMRANDRRETADIPTEILRNGAHALLAQAVEGGCGTSLPPLPRLNANYRHRRCG